jgi:hypothetical protein
VEQAMFLSTTNSALTFSSLRLASLFCGLAVMLAAQTAFAQSGIPTGPLSNVGGYSGQALKSLYNSDVGTGYTGQSLNNIALQNAQARVPYVGQNTDSAPAATIGPGIGARSTKPFSSITTTPTVSPYLNLFNNSRTGTSAFNYQTLVRPQLQQQAINQQQQRQNLDVDRKVQALAARGAYSHPEGSDQQVPTGHQTTFMYYGHYYADEGPHRKRTQ